MNTKLHCLQDWRQLAKEANWSVAQLAVLNGVSVRALELYFQKAKGMPPKIWLTEERLRLALELLRNGASVKETAAQLGYKHSHHFSRALKCHFGYCPTQAVSIPVLD
jgi:transcriptional regulator GlxA family with amidase domain